jgi:elongation factor P
MARYGASLGRRLISERAWVCVKVGNTVLIDGVPFLVTKALQGGRGRGASFVKSTIKNRYTGKSMDKTFNSEDPLEIPDVVQYSVEYSWRDDSVDEYVFMDNNTFEEVRVPSHVVSKPKFLVPGQKFSIAKYKDAIIDLVFPHTGEFTVASVDEQVKL